MSSQNPSQTYPMPSPSVSTFTFPSTTEPVFSASTSEPRDKRKNILLQFFMKIIWLVITSKMMQEIFVLAVKARFGVLLAQIQRCHILINPIQLLLSTSSSHTASSNVMENVLHSFVAESDPQQQITYEDFDQIRKLDLEELDIKWQMAMLSVRINRFEKKAGRKMKFNNKDAARFDKKKVKCYKCSELGHFARECTGKQLDSKARYSSFKLKELDKTEEPKALLSVDSMLKLDDAAVVCDEDVADDVSNVAAEFALMGISSQIKDFGLGFGELLDQMRCLSSAPSIFDTTLTMLTENLSMTVTKVLRLRRPWTLHPVFHSCQVLKLQAP
ncbi:ribonuclease H-like domain-containing protein [Tanacetum coccineum]